MKTIIQRYLGASFLLPFFTTTIFILAFLLTFQMFRIIDLVVNKGVPLIAIFELLFHITISFLPMAIPLSLLFASIFILNKISGDSEFIAMRSFGLSKFKIFLPFLLISIVVALITFALNRSIIPNSNREFKRAIIILTSKGFLADIKPGVFFTAIPNVSLFAEKVTNEGKDLENIFIYTKNSEETKENLIFARYGNLIKPNENKWGHSSLRLKLTDGNILKKINNNEKVEKIIFGTYDFPITEGKITAGMVTKDSMRTSDELYQLINLSDEEIKKRNIFKRDHIKTKIEFWSRINTSLTCIIFVLLGFTLGIKNTRGKSRNSAVIAMFILVIYYSLYFAGLSFARSDTIPVLIVVFLPSIVSLIFGVRFFKKLEWAA